MFKCTSLILYSDVDQDTLDFIMTLKPGILLGDIQPQSSSCLDYPCILGTLANCEDPYEMQHYAAFHPGLHFCLTKTTFRARNTS